MSATLHLTDVLILLAAAIVAVPLFQRLRLGSVLGYLAAGAAVGPWGFGFIDEVEVIRHIAEFGVVFLLFIIGIELKPERLWAMRHAVFGLGTAQVFVTGLAIAAAAYAFGQTLEVSLIIGFGLALSSTAFCLQLLNERGELGTGYGRTALSILLLQDLAVVPLLALVSLLAADSTSLRQGIGLAALQAVTAIVIVLVAGRYLLTPLLRLVATSRTAEVFTAAAVLAVLGTAWLMEFAGLSLALGAFLAGLLLADSHYRHQVIADIEPFRSILLGLFFMGVGMSVDIGLLGREALPIVVLVAGLLVLKAAILWLLCRLMRLNAAVATRTSLLLSQSGEFGFVIFGLAGASGLVPPETFRFLVLLVALTMITTPLMPALGERLAKMFHSATDQGTGLDTVGGEPPHVIIAGFGRVGRRVAAVLSEADVPYIAIENDPDRVQEARQDGYPVYFGDASQADLLEIAGVGRGALLVCTLNNPVPAVRMVTVLRQHYPDITILARGHNRAHCDDLLEAGATVAVSETLEASLQLGSEVLQHMGKEATESDRLIEIIRAREHG